MTDKLPYPPTPQCIVRKTIGGISFDDPYDWLQTDTVESLDCQVRQNALAEANLRSWHGFERLRTAIEQSVAPAKSVFAAIPQRAGGRWFRLAEVAAGKGEAVWVSDSPTSGGSIVTDMARLQKNLKTERPVHITQFTPSPGGKLVALSLTIGGNPEEYFRVVETDGGKILESVSYQHPYEAAFPVWRPDGSGFFLAGERHAGGSHCLKFIPVTSDALPYPDALFDLSAVPENIPILTPQVSPSGRYVVLVSGPHEWMAIQVGDLRTGVWRRFVPLDFSGECYGNWIDDEHYAAVVTENSPRGRVVSIPVRTSQERNSWREIVPQTDLVLRNLIVAGGQLALVGLKDVSLFVSMHRVDGSLIDAMPLEPYGFSSLTNHFQYVTRSEELLFTFGTFTRQESLFRYHFDSHAIEALGASGMVLGDLQSSQRFARSPDGTRIPYFLVHRKDLQAKGPHPLLIHAYGGFNQSKMPEYLGEFTPFVRAGGIFVLANLRGGSEYGKAWHEGGRLTHKQNTFDDLYAVAEDLIRAGLTAPDRLAFYGRSNGGLTAGVALVQRPDLWRVVVPVVPLLDMLEPVLPGLAASEAIRSYFVEDFGDPHDPDLAPIIYKYSPYHNIRGGVKYPSVLLVFGNKDLGCPAYHGRKFAARLQAATASDHPILLRVWEDVGHHAVGPESILQFAEFLGFIMRELGMHIP